MKSENSRIQDAIGDYYKPHREVYITDNSYKLVNTTSLTLKF